MTVARPDEARADFFWQEQFGVSYEQAVRAMRHSPNARGYLLGAISEMFLYETLKASGLEVQRIKEKWEGEKKHHGDFYISKDGRDWFVVESKGLKTNSEKWNPNFFNQTKSGRKQRPESTWFEALPKKTQEKLTESASIQDLAFCQTHMPSSKGTFNRTQASPRYDEFHLLAVDLFVKTHLHSFVFALSSELARSPKDPNHLFQNYFITLAIPSEQKYIEPLMAPWTKNLSDVLSKLESPIQSAEMQIDTRLPGQRAEGVRAF